MHENQETQLTRGGVMSLETNLNAEFAYYEKAKENYDEKARIAAAAKLIQPGDVAMLDAGTTPRLMARHLGGLHPLNVVANDILIATDLSGFENLTVTVTGGVLRPHFFTLRSFAAEDLMGSMQAKIAFIGADAVSPRTGCMVTDIDKVRFKQCMIEAAHKSVVLCDHIKFNNHSLISFAPLSKIDTIITDDCLDKRVYDEICEAGVEILLV